MAPGGRTGLDRVSKSGQGGNAMEHGGRVMEFGGRIAEPGAFASRGCAANYATRSSGVATAELDAISSKALWQKMSKSRVSRRQIMLLQ